MRPLTALGGVAFVALLFFVLPSGAASLNASLGWPTWKTTAGQVGGWALIAAGAGLAVYCSGLFRRLGGGTPVPIEPPTRLVVAGLYRYTRNPMYVADLAILIGIFGVRGEAALLLYAGVFSAFIQLWLVLHEEPVLVKRFGADYEDYRGRLPRWLGRGV